MKPFPRQMSKSGPVIDTVARYRVNDDYLFRLRRRMHLSARAS